MRCASRVQREAGWNPKHGMLCTLACYVHCYMHGMLCRVQCELPVFFVVHEGHIRRRHMDTWYTSRMTGALDMMHAT